jgi:hypothetical protein
MKIIGSGSDNCGTYLIAITSASSVIPWGAALDDPDSVVMVFGASEIKVLISPPPLHSHAHAVWVSQVRVMLDTQAGQLKWKLQLPHSPETPNEDVLSFINRYITTNDEIPIRFRAGSTCGQSLQPVEAKIRGIKSLFIRNVDVRIGFAIILQRTLTFTYEVGMYIFFAPFPYCSPIYVLYILDNPLDTPLTIYNFKADAYISPTRIQILQIEHTFGPPFCVPVCNITLIAFFSQGIHPY